MAGRTRGAQEADIERLAMAMPHVVREDGSGGNAVFSVGGKSFIFFRNPRPDAVDPDTGERYTDVVAIWTQTLEDKESLVQDPDLPFFTTPHFNGYRAVLLRTSRMAELPLDVLAETIEDAWLARASVTRRKRWLAAHPGTPAASSQNS
ncbi:MAG: hypothetical protein ABI131_08115 [Nostocoides sp.]